MPARKLPDDVEPDQVWRASDGQHYKVVSVHAGIATLQRCTPAGRVLNQRYKTAEAVDRMQTEFKLVSGWALRPRDGCTARYSAQMSRRSAVRSGSVGGLARRRVVLVHRPRGVMYGMPKGVPEMKAVLICLVVACGASLSPASAQMPATSVLVGKPAATVGARVHSCVHPSDALALRWFQDEPCVWPMYELPVSIAAGPNEPRPLPEFAQPLAGAQAGHAMFWRFPVQPMGPHEVPRHSLR